MNIGRLRAAWIVLVALAAHLSLTRPIAAETVAPTPASDVALRVPAHPVALQKAPGRDAIELVRQSPRTVERLDSGVMRVDFGRVAFGNLELTSPAGFQDEIVVRFGEKQANGAIDRDPPGTVRYSEVRAQIVPGTTTVIAPSVDDRNTQQSGAVGRYGNVTPPAVLTPPEWGVVTPFRWVEIEGIPAGEDAAKAVTVVRLAAFPKHWDEGAAEFHCSDATLNRVWDLCRYSIKATLFAGVYVDGDRERIPYEADAYLNQLSHYYVDADPKAARRTFDWLLKHPTWPTEWGPHMVFMAHADWMRNGDAEWIRQRYESLKAKTLFERLGKDGLVHSNAQQIDWDDIVDWPPVERDGCVRTEVNTVVNAFHLAAVEKMAELAAAVGADADVQYYQERAEHGRRVFRSQLFDADAGLYRDGVGVNHHSQHANFFPLAFGLVEKKDRQKVAEWLASRGMRCSVYGAQYLLESLFENGAGEAAVGLIVAPGERSWRHMLDSDATITWEAWNESAKPNLDWNHAWGAAPANLLPRYVLGAEPLAPGWSRARIRPNPSGLEFARGVVPTPRGPVAIDWRLDRRFSMDLDLPDRMTAFVQVPNVTGAEGIFVNGSSAEAKLIDGYWVLKDELKGRSAIEVR
ncbi:Bacterial alpha-L-rhamnosidase [Pirellulimonas nuda]|uniref:alpha-L-rhamnosidase n=1 Tax=Pirellulimonas nuda TaxID=2528009 RepID=A0A518DBT6_9BACT|nr:alpha-L-rhamnosidase C-terminal domain-containing protein [Pirellulimonas nuda]QDU88906.1 Bacterial alpha-L-rhamnosidase [Pirellulimonas nuda]